MRKQISDLWTRVMLRHTAFTGSYGKLRALYARRDPWNMASKREQHRFQATNDLLSGVQATYESILELGSGEGHQSASLARLTDRFHGIDISEFAVRRAQNLVPQGAFRVGPLEAIERIYPDVDFELITACEVLYYLPDPATVLPLLQARCQQLFVSSYSERTEGLRAALKGPGWQSLPDIRYQDTAWNCFLWQR
jgi:2-polyprenyl-3-methyl-5-hydroxy-6-metoxy-1,4-benzoquinol methylase